MADFSDLIGKPFADLGRGPDTYDCWGVVLEVNRRLGRELSDYGVSCHVWDHVEILQRYQNAVGQFEKVANGHQPGDVVLFRRFSGGLHFGVVIDQYYCLHTTENTGIQMQRLDSPTMRKLIKGFYRWTG